MRTGKSNGAARVALCGVFGALALALMLMGGILPAATFAAPAFAGILIMPAAVEFGVRTGALLYAAIGILALFAVPDKEMALIFLFFLGYYPLVKIYLERIRPRAARWAAKLALFNACVFAMYWLILAVFPLPEVAQEYAEMGRAFLAALIVLANVTFVLYDVAVARLVGLYCAKLRPRLLHRP